MTIANVMDDLVKRLRNWAEDDWHAEPGPLNHFKKIQFEAADEIERLTAELDALQTKLSTALVKEQQNG